MSILLALSSGLLHKYARECFRKTCLLKLDGPFATPNLSGSWQHTFIFHWYRLLCGFGHLSKAAVLHAVTQASKLLWSSCSAMTTWVLYDHHSREESVERIHTYFSMLWPRGDTCHFQLQSIDQNKSQASSLTNESLRNVGESVQYFRAFQSIFSGLWLSFILAKERSDWAGIGAFSMEHLSRAEFLLVSPRQPSFPGSEHMWLSCCSSCTLVSPPWKNTL